MRAARTVPRDAPDRIARSGGEAVSRCSDSEQSRRERAHFDGNQTVVRSLLSRLRSVQSAALMSNANPAVGLLPARTPFALATSESPPLSLPGSFFVAATVCLLLGSVGLVWVAPESPLVRSMSPPSPRRPTVHARIHHALHLRALCHSCPSRLVARCGGQHWRDGPCCSSPAVWRFLKPDS